MAAVRGFLGIALAAIGFLAWAGVAVRPVGAGTLAYWRFEGDGTSVPTAGMQVEDTNGRNLGIIFPNPPGVAVADASGNGNTLRAWDHAFAGHTYRASVPVAALASGLPNGFSVQNAGSFPALSTWSLKSTPTTDAERVKPLAWTIEATIMQTAANLHSTFVGRDGNRDAGAGDASRAPLYFKTFNGTLQLLFTDEGGRTYDLSDPTGPLTLNAWYNVAAVSDGATLKLYKDSGAGYKLVNSQALTPGDTRLNYDDGGSTTAGDAQWGWTVGRGRYGSSTLQADGHTDRWFGSIDEVRISDEALDPAEFLFLPTPLRLVVNTVTGAVAIRNAGPNAVAFNYYQIDSPDPDGPGGTPGGALNEDSWNSFQDQRLDVLPLTNFDGDGNVGASDLAVWQAAFGVAAAADADNDGDSDGADFLAWQRDLGKLSQVGDNWDEAVRSSNVALAELFLNGGTTLDPGAELSLGNAFDPTVFGSGVDGNLTFRFGAVGDATTYEAIVEYLTTGPAAAAPEPASLASAACGIVALATVRRRDRRLMRATFRTDHS